MCVPVSKYHAMKVYRDRARKVPNVLNPSTRWLSDGEWSALRFVASYLETYLWVSTEWVARWDIRTDLDTAANVGTAALYVQPVASNITD
jgi:hypothetical protein